MDHEGKRGRENRRERGKGDKVEEIASARVEK